MRINHKILTRFEEDPNYKRVRSKLSKEFTLCQERLKTMPDVEGEEFQEVKKQHDDVIDKIKLWDSIHGVDIWDTKGKY